MPQVPDMVASPLETIELARRLIGEGRAFSAHEVLESQWKRGPVEERDLWRGLAQLCVAITHAARGNQVGAARVLARAQDVLARYQDSDGPTYGVDLTRAWEQARDSVAARGASRLAPLSATPVMPSSKLTHRQARPLEVVIQWARQDPKTRTVGTARAVMPLRAFAGLA